MSELEWQTVRELMAFASRLRETVENSLLPSGEAVLARSGVYEPAVDVWEGESDIVVEVELPGVPADGIELRLEGGALHLSGEMPEGAEPAAAFLRIERMRGRFQRTVQLPVDVTEPPTATVRNGVLRVRLPKAQPARRRVGIVTEGS